MNLLLLHGALGSAGQLKPLQQQVGGVTIDLSGHGGREIPAEGLRFEQFITDIDKAYAQHGWDSADLFGYSMGGYAALLYAAKHPERVRSVTTLGTMMVLGGDSLQKELRKLDPDMMEAKVPAFARRLAEVHGEDRWRAVVRAVAKSMEDLGASPLLTEEVIAQIMCPVLLCVGDGDTGAGTDNTRTFAARLRTSEVCVLPATRHPFEEVDLEFLVPRMNAFWEALDQS